jgi:peptide/nickel transport system substrate-binding protein
MKKSARLLSLMLALALVVTALAGCAAESEEEPAAEEPAEAATVDTFTYAQGADPRGLYPALVDDGESSKVIVNIYEGLLKYNSESTEVEPSLAESWTISDDGLAYTFKLREGVKFHDGTDFNAEAVKFNIDRQLPPQVTEGDGLRRFRVRLGQGRRGRR